MIFCAIVDSLNVFANKDGYRVGYGWNKGTDHNPNLIFTSFRNT